MPTIYDIKKEFLTLWSVLEDELTDDETLAGAFETATDDLKEKLEASCKYITNEKAVIQGLKDEENRLKARRQAKENAIERLKKLMLDAMIAAGEKKLPCGTFTCSVQANPERVIMDEPYIENVPEEYLKIPEPEIDKAKIKEDLKAGKDLGGIAHLERTDGLRIR